MSKGVFIGFFLGGLILSFLSPFLAAAVMSLFKGAIGATPDWVGAIVLPLLVFFAFCSALAVVVFIYDMWRSIQDGHARTSPGLAFALLLIPVFNVYWVFQALWGLAKDYNAYIRRYHIGTPPLPEGLFLTASITFSLSYLPILFGLIGILLYWAGISAGFSAVVGAISLVGNLAGWANLVIIPIIMSRGCNASNAIRNVAA
jgi:hypothetical protein